MPHKNVLRQSTSVAILAFTLLTPAHANDIRMHVLLASNDVAAASAPQVSPESLAQEFCSRCHIAPTPLQHTAAQWPAVVDRMERYMYYRRLTMPDQQQTAAILSYLEQHSRE